MEHANKIWIAVGFAGQALFFGRFFVQWLASERARRSVIPTAFWYFSIGGGLVLTAYAIYRRDPVFIVGQASGLATVEVFQARCVSTNAIKGTD